MHPRFVMESARGAGEAAFFALGQRLRERITACTDLTGLRECVDAADAAALMVRTSGMAREAEQLAQELRLRANRRLGQFLDGRVRGKGRPSVESHGLLKLAEVGLDRGTWMYCRRLAAIPEGDFENVCRDKHFRTLSSRKLTRRAERGDATAAAGKAFDRWLGRTMRDVPAAALPALAARLRDAAAALEVALEVAL